VKKGQKTEAWMGADLRTMAAMDNTASLDGRRSHDHGSDGQHRRCRNEMGGGKLPVQPSTRLVCWRCVQHPALDLADRKEEKPD